MSNTETNTSTLVIDEDTVDNKAVTTEAEVVQPLTNKEIIEKELKARKSDIERAKSFIEDKLKEIEIQQQKKKEIEDELAKFNEDKKKNEVATTEIKELQHISQIIKKESEISNINRTIKSLNTTIEMFRNRNIKRIEIIEILESNKSDKEKLEAIEKYYWNLKKWYTKVWGSLRIPIVSPMIRFLAGPVYRGLFYNPLLKLQGKDTVPLTDAHKGKPVINLKSGILRGFLGGKSKRKTSTKKNNTLRKKSVY